MLCGMWRVACVAWCAELGSSKDDHLGDGNRPGRRNPATCGTKAIKKDEYLGVERGGRLLEVHLQPCFRVFGFQGVGYRVFGF